MGKRMSTTTNEPELRGSATKNGQAPVIQESVAITPEKLQADTRSMMQSTSKTIADELTSPVAQMVSHQLAVNVLSKLPAIVEYTGDNIKDFLSGALNTDNLMGANPLTPYLKLAGIEEE